MALGRGFLAFGGAYEHHPFADRRRAGAGGHALAIELDAGGLIAAEHLAKGVAEFALEIEHLAVIGAELLLKGHPGDESGFAGVDAVEPLRQPGVNVEAHSRMRQSRRGRLH